MLQHRLSAQTQMVIALRGKATTYEIAQQLGIPRGRVTQIWWEDRQREASPYADVQSKEELAEKVAAVVAKLNAPGPIIAHGPTVETLVADDCRFPLGQDADGQWRFCGCPRHRALRSSYCAQHHRATHTATPLFVLEAA